LNCRSFNFFNYSYIVPCLQVQINPQKMQKITLKFLYTLLVFIVSNTYIQSQNLLNNGDFESGGNGVGFNLNGSGYNLITAPFSGSTVAGNYAFTSNPQPMNTANFISGGDHTSGTGNMMVIDGNSTGGQQRFWRAGSSGGGVCSLTVGATYTFSYWIKSVSTTVSNNATRADIGIQFNNAINVSPVGSTMAPLPAAGWQKVTYTFQPTNSCVNIELYNNNTSLVGNDFAIDDFSLLPPPQPLSLTYSALNPQCPGASSGSIIGYASGGTLPYGNYSLTGAATASNTSGIFTNLPAGTYTLAVTDNAGTNATQSNIVLTNPTDLTIGASATTICSGITTTLSVSGSPFVYNWTASPADPTLTTPNSSNPTVSPTVNTTYTATSTVFTPTNFVYNGNFSLGNVGFATDYTNYDPTNPTGAQRAYGVVQAANVWEPTFSACVDHTSGTGNMLIADGSTFNTGNDRLWCQTIPVVSGQNYTFGYWVQTVSPTNPANLDVVINGVSIGTSAAPAGTCGWTQVTYVWNSGANTTAQICIYDRNTSLAGNDFAIDDITFTRTVSCTLQKSILITVVNSLVLTITNPPTVCTPATVDLSLPAVTVGSTSGTTLTYWVDAAATIPLINYTAVAVSGTYYIKSTVGTCSVIKPVVVTINATGSMAAPVVTTPVYFCQGSTATPLTATALPGATLHWYATPTSTTPLPGAPVPPTNAVGPNFYYVSQSTGLCESPRAAITVNVNNITGNYNLHCDQSQASTPNSVYFDWSNIPGGAHDYTITYSINAGPLVSDTTNNSSYEVFGVSSGQTVTLTIVSNPAVPCVALPISVTCGLACTTTTTPIFASVPSSICNGASPPLLPATSDNGITGSWSPAVVSNTANGSYTFTPNIATFPCASTLTKTITITPFANAGTINGTQNVCVGLTTTFSSTAAGGTWSSVDPTIATVNSANGIVTGVGPGTTTINYTVLATGGCGPNAIASRTVTVTAPPTTGTLNGTQNVCVGFTTTFGSTVSGGLWNSSNTAVATVNASTGIITGVSAGTSNITYTVSGTGGCASVTSPARIVTVSAPATAGSLNGNQNICVSSTATYTSTASGGTWSSSNPTVATVSASGVITGVSAGTSTITYTVAQTGGCIAVPSATATRVVTVTAPPNPGTISGNQNVCVGLTTSFFSTISGGTWFSSNPSVATINATTGVINGISAGTSTIIYTVSGAGGCSSVDSAPRIVTVTANPVSGTLSGNQNICVGSTSNFSSTVSGGIWTSLNPTIATVNALGLVTGVGPGTATIQYKVLATGGCVTDAIATRTITVATPPNPGTLSGTQNICSGTTTLFASTTTGGLWSSSNTAVATVNAATGMVTGVAAGTANITYTVTGTGGCASVTSAPRTITVTAAPNAGNVTTANQNICIGSTTPYLSTVVGGAWSSSNTAVATVNPSTGVVTGISAGNSNILYTVNGIGGCIGTNAVSLLNVVVTAPLNAGTLSGTQNICEGTTTTFASTVAGGNWSSTNTAVATVNTVTGLVTGIAPGTADIIYTISATGGCPAVQSLPRTITINPRTNPDFPGIAPFCSGGGVPTLDPVSPNGITGTWFPIAIDNTLVGTNDYIFTPAVTECANAQVLSVTVIAPTIPDFIDIEICEGSVPPLLLPVSPNGVPGTWSPPVIDSSLVGNTIYNFTPDPGECALPTTIQVTVNQYTLTHIEGVVSNYFDDVQVITVLASGPGEYLYQIDYGPLQESNVFQDVTAGLHTITVYDKNNCGPPMSDPNIMVINYPPFFTPNGDGYNDTWNITGLSDQPDSRIFIFDRYGKLIKEISPAGTGWDGTYNGALMPSTDYWFTVDYLENAASKQFKAHFSLKR